jgi:hypothetical protein
MRYTLCDKGETVARIVLVMLVVLIAAPEDVASSGAAWQGKRVAIWNHAGIAWEPFLRQGIAHINRSLPRNAPRFRYRQGAASCRGHRRAIAVCARQGLPVAGYTITTSRRHEMTRGRIVLLPFAEFTDPLVIVCHELGHAISGVPERKIPVEACPYNERFSRKAYRQHGRR